MATINYILDTRRALSSGLYPLKIRVTHDRKSKFYPTEIALNEASFERLKGSGKLSDDLREIKVKLATLTKKGERIINGMLIFSFEAFTLRFVAKGDRSCLLHMLTKIKEDFESQGKISTSEIYKQTIASIKEFTGKTEINIREVNTEWLNKYERWAREKVSATTVHFRLSKVQRVFNDAIGLGELDPGLNPFGKEKHKKYALKRTINNKRPLSLAEIMKLYNYTPEFDGEDFARDMFIFSYLCGGMNMADIFNLKWKDLQIDSFSFIREKTKHSSQTPQTITISVNEDISSIISRHGSKKINNDYIFNIYKPGMPPTEIRRVKLNTICAMIRTLKKIAVKIDINPNISTYYARHSYATILMDSGTPLAFISKKLGHKDIATTQDYLAQFSKEKSDGFEAGLLSKNAG